METIVSILRDKFHWSRKFTCIIVTVIALIMGIPSSLGFGIWSDITFLNLSILDAFDFLSNSILMPILAFFTCIFVGFVIKPKVVIDEVKAQTEHSRREVIRSYDQMDRTDLLNCNPCKFRRKCNGMVDNLIFH